MHQNGRRRCKSKENGRNNPFNELLTDFSTKLKQFLHRLERPAIKDLSTCCGIRSWLLVRRLIGKTIRCLLSFSGLTTYYPRGISRRQYYVVWLSVKVVTSYESQRRRNLWSFMFGCYFDYLRPGEKDQWERKPTGNEFSVVELMRSRSRRNRGHYIRIMSVSSNFFLLEACCILWYMNASIQIRYVTVTDLMQMILKKLQNKYNNGFIGALKRWPIF